MKTHSLLALACLLPAALTAAESPAAIRAAIAAHDRAIHVHDTWIRDPYITTGPDGYYYYTGTTQRPGTPVNDESRYNTGLGNGSLVGWHVHVWRSADLVTWEPLGSPYNLKDTVWYEAERGAFDQTPPADWRIWAPELHWLGERWALIHTTPRPLAPKVGATLALTPGADVKGPWSSPVGTRIGQRHDPSLFRDTDRTWWMIWGATEIAPLKPDFSDYAAAPVRIGPSGESARMGHEGCLLQKIEGRYVLFGTGWSTGQMRKGSYNLYYATADRITGPYSERKFVGRFLGHGTPFRDRQGRWWCTAFFNGNVPPLSGEGIVTRDLGADAQTINQQGLTLVPLEVRFSDGDVVIRAKDPRYATPGPDEAQSFSGRAPRENPPAAPKGKKAGKRSSKSP
jgi:arylsulfatase